MPKESYGGWEVFQKKPGTAKISVTAEIDGKRKHGLFRVQSNENSKARA